MKILQIISYYNPAWGFGGPPRVMFDYAKGLKKRGHDITVFTTDAYAKNARIGSSYKEIDGIKVYYFKNISNKLAWRRKKFLPLGFRRCLKRHIKEFDILHLSDVRNYLNAVAWRIAKRADVPYIVSAFGSLPRRQEGIKTIYDFFFTKPMIKNAAALLAQTEHEAMLYQQFGVSNSQIKLVPLPIDLTSFKDLPSKGMFRKKYQIQPQEKIILFLGRLHYLKGIDLLLQSFKNLVKINNNLKLVIIGRDDGYLPAMRNLIKKWSIENKVIFTGPLYDKDKLSAYVDADVFCIPACHWEETSTASLEAAACYTPIIATNRASVPYLEGYKAGFHINYNQAELEEKIKLLLDDENLHKNYAQSARKLIEEKFEVNKICEQLEKIYEEFQKSISG